MGGGGEGDTHNQVIFTFMIGKGKSNDLTNFSEDLNKKYPIKKFDFKT